MAWPESLHGSDMWATYLKLAQRAGGIRFRFWIAFTSLKKSHEKINEVSAHKKSKQLAADGHEASLKNSTLGAC